MENSRGGKFKINKGGWNKRVVGISGVGLTDSEHQVRNYGLVKIQNVSISIKLINGGVGIGRNFFKN